MTDKKCPVCGMDARADISSTYDGKTYNFCCPTCKEQFMINPQQYIKGAPQAAGS